jgi:uncharacterized protein (DUF4213/DUF364 family)
MDLLRQLFSQFPFSQSAIKAFVCGEKNVAVMLKNGNIGVCSTLCHKVEVDTKILKNPNFSIYNHRIIVNAWVNACTNYGFQVSGYTDIFTAIEFSVFKQVVMIGYFRSLNEKLRSIGVNLSVFDLDEEEKPVEPIINQNKVIQTADAVILTATSISNGTIKSIMDVVPLKTKVFILGPSTPLSQAMFSIPTVCGMFGARFHPFDNEVLSAIASGGGTRSFLSRMEKVYLLRD